ncbi:MAG: hypothetical protein Q8N53_06080, partial [Longimicrobiales bacterium]|nr:hypothetical protein [Longimicrobiales bacterium]
ITISPSYRTCIGSGWATWSNGFRGNVYPTGGSKTQTITLPAGTKAFYFYVEPNPFSLQTFQVVAQPGDVSSGSFSAHGSSGAVYVGVFDRGGTITSVTITGSTDFATGEYGWSSGAASLSAPGWMAPALRGPQPPAISPLPQGDILPRFGPTPPGQNAALPAAVAGDDAKRGRIR